MKRAALGLLVLLVFGFPVFAQSETNGLKTIELLAPYGADGRHDAAAARFSCYSFIAEEFNCRLSDIYYGGIRSGEDWDWFWARGAGDRNRIKELGRKEWADEFEVPVVEPYAKLKEGERRNIFWDASGADGADGANGVNGDGTVSTGADLDRTARVDARLPREKKRSEYHPFEKAAVGRMYVMRVVDETNDFYVLFRVEELERGRRCRIAWKKIAAPERN